MLSKTAWIVPTALALVTCILVGATGLVIFLPLAAVFLLTTVYVMWRDFRPKDKYSLDALREVEDKDELARLHRDPNVGVFEFDDYLCPYCRTHYSMEFRNCPKCGRPRSS